MPVVAGPPLLLNLLRNPPSLAAANVGNVDPGNPPLILNPQQIAAFVAGETIQVQFQIGNGVTALETLTSRTYRAAIGGLNQPATGGLGTWGDGTVTYSPQLPYNASALCVQNALNSLNANAGPSSGLVEVTGPANGAPYMVIWNTPGARNLITVDPSDLAPLCQVIVQRVQTGTSGVREIQLIQIIQQPLAYTSTWTIATTTATGILVFNTPAVIQFLAANPSGQTFLEIEENDGTNIRKICQIPVALNGYVVGPTSNFVPFPVGYQKGMAVVTSGNQSVALVFPAAFQSAPSFFSPGGVGMPDSVTGQLTVTFDNSTLTASGVTLWLSAPAPASGYVIPWLAIQ